MTPDGRYTAVLDRFEGEVAVLLLEADGETVDDRDVPRADLPSEGRHVDAVFEIQVENDDIVDVDYAEDETERRHESVRRRFDRLARRPDDEE